MPTIKLGKGSGYIKKCPTARGKRCYRTRPDALNAATQYQKKYREEKRNNVYQCVVCEWWHITSGEVPSEDEQRGKTRVSTDTPPHIIRNRIKDAVDPEVLSKLEALRNADDR
jgi:hypothetical protein